MSAITLDAPAVRALLAGEGWEVRVPVRPEPNSAAVGFTPAASGKHWLQLLPISDPSGVLTGRPVETTFTSGSFLCPLAPVGRSLWVRERWRPVDHDFGMPPLAWLLEGEAGEKWWRNPPEEQRSRCVVRFGSAHTTGGCDPRWRPASRMPRWASRLTVTVASVRCERTGAGWVWVVGLEASK